MNSIFLRAKHWQLFIPLAVIPFVVSIILGISVAITLVLNEPKSPEDVIWVFYLFPVIFILCGFVQFAWFWNVLTKLSKLVNPAVKFPQRRIKLFFFIPVIYLCLVPFFAVYVIQTTFASHQHIDEIMQLVILGVFVFILHFFSIFCILHTIYFAAKTIRSAELQTNARFSDFVGDFFLIWIFPVGIWFIQPRINKLVEKTANSSTGEELIDRF